MSNVIERDGDVIGFVEDLCRYLVDNLEKYAKDKNWGMTSEVAEILEDLSRFSGNQQLLIISENNGMGYTIKEYKKGE